LIVVFGFLRKNHFSKKCRRGTRENEEMRPPSNESWDPKV
jgi:hypothetical protein